jgi:hypothetical protein
VHEDFDGAWDFAELECDFFDFDGEVWDVSVVGGVMWVVEYVPFSSFVMSGCRYAYGSLQVQAVNTSIFSCWLSWNRLLGNAVKKPVTASRSPSYMVKVCASFTMRSIGVSQVFWRKAKYAS